MTIEAEYDISDLKLQPCETLEYNYDQEEAGTSEGSKQLEIKKSKVFKEDPEN